MALADRGRLKASAAAQGSASAPRWHVVLAGFLLALERFGYDVSDSLAAVVAFQRRFRPELIDGTVDGECRALLLALLLPKPMGDE